MNLIDFFEKQTNNILTRAKDYPNIVKTIDGETLYFVEQLIYGIPVVATKEKLDMYATKLKTKVNFTNNGNIALVNFNNISSPVLIPEIWAIPSYGGYKDAFIKEMGIPVSATELKDEGYDIDHWFSRGQVESLKYNDIYLRLILTDASTNRSHGAASERMFASNNGKSGYHTKDLEYMTPPQFLKAIGERFSKKILKNPKYENEKEYLINLLADNLHVPRDIAKSLYIDHYYQFAYESTWNYKFLM